MSEQVQYQSQIFRLSLARNQEEEFAYKQYVIFYHMDLGLPRI